MDFLTFILVSVGLIIIPGPNVLLIISTSLTHGSVRGMQTVVGTSIAMILQLAVAALGTAWFVAALAQGFVWLKWLGVGYLAYLGTSHLIRAFSDSGEKSEVSGIGSFHRGFWVSLTNPKTILFFSAFLPQFTMADAPYLTQIALLSLIFWVLALVLDSSWVFLSGKLSAMLENKMLPKYQDTASGLLFLGAGAALAIVKVSDK